MEKCDKRNNKTSSKLHMICISSNNDRHPVNKTFTPLHYNSAKYTSLHFITIINTSLFTQLHFTTLAFSLTPFKFPTAPFHLTSLHFTLLHFTVLLDDFRHTSIIFTSPRSIRNISILGKPEFHYRLHRS